MNIAQYRPSFTVFVIDKQLERSDKVFLALKNAGYAAHTCLSSEQFFEWVKDDPPHIVFVEQDTLIVLGETFVEDSLKVLPEVHIIVYSEQSEIFSAHHFFDHGVYDCVAYSDGNLEFIVKSADRAAENDYYRYMNEQLQMRYERETPIADSSYTIFDLWMSQLVDKRNLKEAIDHFLAEASRYTGNKEVVFFKYIPSHQSLVASQSVVTDIKKVRGMGYELTKEEKNFTLDLLLRPQSLTGVRKVVNSALGIEKYECLPLVVQGVPEGIFVFLDCKDKMADPYLKSCLRSLAVKLGQINLSKKLHTVSINDDKTRVLNRQNFIETLKKEISRSRRITMPVTLVLISIDKFEELEKRLSRYEVDMLLKMCATILKRHSRINDIVGRLDDSEFGIILPHTGKLGGAIKGERLRKIFESADFTKVIPSSKQLTISIGISEYPSHCRDFEDIIRTADEALFEVRKKGFNKVCLASAPDGFIPDFILDGTKL